MVDGLFSPDSVAWRIHSDPSMLVGGIRALLQQALHPEAMDGVAKNSNFREDAWGRLQRTGDYVSTLTFGTSVEANALASRVRIVHSKFGVDEPKLLLWVHMSMVDSFLDCAIRSGLDLTQDEQDQYLQEMATFATLVGISQEMVPVTREQMAKYFQHIAPELRASDDAKRAALFLAIPPFRPLCALQLLQLLCGQPFLHWQDLHFQIGPANFMAGQHCLDKAPLPTLHFAPHVTHSCFYRKH